MIQLEEACQALARIAPLRLAESWDNVGLLVGDRSRSVSRVMTCLTITPNVVAEAVSEQVDLVVTHHPLPFKPLQRITSDTTSGKMLLQLIAGNVAVYSAHTAFDSAQEGINQQWADQLQLTEIQTLLPVDDGQDDLGAGRMGAIAGPTTLEQLAQRSATLVHASAPRLVGQTDAVVTRVALACGSGGSFLSAARRRGCEAMITGEATFHTCLEAESAGVGLVLLGHYYSERFAMERLADRLAGEFSDLAVWASRQERDPVVAVALKH
ncbi:MAG: Nif3-like dinuclear metal center hexameric protein [Rubripirellula sp.]|nr:Nif3-like dinuclear metal center hexameric protein [Rubripirellula sp.]